MVYMQTRGLSQVRDDGQVSRSAICAMLAPPPRTGTQQSAGIFEVKTLRADVKYSAM